MLVIITDPGERVKRVNFGLRRREELTDAEASSNELQPTKVAVETRREGIIVGRCRQV
jgi:hypothetical protein